MENAQVFAGKTETLHPNSVVVSVQHYCVYIPFGQLVIYAACLRCLLRKLCEVSMVLLKSGIQRGGLQDYSQLPLIFFPPHVFDRECYTFLFFSLPVARDQL